MLVVRDAADLAFVRCGRGATRRTRPSDLTTDRVVGNLRPKVLKAPKAAAPVMSTPTRNHPSVPQALGHTRSRSTVSASSVHRGKDLAVPAGLARIMVAAVQDVVDLPTDHRAMRNPKRRIDR